MTIDDLSGVLDDAVYNVDADADVGTVTYGEPVLSWVGDLPVGVSATVTYSVTVTNTGQVDLVDQWFESVGGSRRRCLRRGR